MRIPRISYLPLIQIIGAVTTYLVILVQFQISFTPQHDAVSVAAAGIHRDSSETRYMAQ